MSPSEFLQVATNALAEAKQEETVVQLDLRYQSNKKDKMFMYNYLARRTVLRLDNMNLLDEYITLLNENERGEIKNLQLILDNGMYLAKSIQLGISLETLKKHKDKFSQLKQSYKEEISGIENTAIANTLRKAIALKDEKLLAQIISLKKPAKFSYFNNKETTQIAYFLGTGQNEKYIHFARNYVNDFLLKISLDTLAKRDERIYSSQLEYLKNDQSFKGDIKEAAQQYKHAITIQLTGAINDLAKSFSNLDADTASLKMAIGWMEYCEKITNQDTDYYQNVIPFYTETHALLSYKIGNKKLAIAKLENMLNIFKNPRVTAYFSPLIYKMKANEKL